MGVRAVTYLACAEKGAMLGRLPLPSNLVYKHYYNGTGVQGGADRVHDQTIFWNRGVMVRKTMCC